jgi:hypothetical protein
MSGGSYDYLEAVETVTLLEGGREEDLERMAKRLEELGAAAAAAATRNVAATMKRLWSVAEATARIEALRQLWHVVEWVDSGDKGDDDLAPAIAKYNEATAEAAAGDTYGVQQDGKRIVRKMRRVANQLAAGADSWQVDKDPAGRDAFAMEINEAIEAAVAAERERCSKTWAADLLDVVAGLEQVLDDLKRDATPHFVRQRLLRMVESNRQIAAALTTEGVPRGE